MCIFNFLYIAIAIQGNISTRILNKLSINNIFILVMGFSHFKVSIWVKILEWDENPQTNKQTTNKQTNKQKDSLRHLKNNDWKERELTKLNCFKYRHFCIIQECLHQVFKLVQTNTGVHFVFSLKWRCRCTTSRQQQIWHDEDPSLVLVHRFWVLVWIVYPFTGKSIASKYFRSWCWSWYYQRINHCQAKRH